MAAHHESWDIPPVDIYAMHLHQTLPVTGVLSVTRVPGGWLYRLTGEQDWLAPVFVPLHNEFQRASSEGYPGK